MSDAAHTLTVLCLASYEKGQEFMRECKRQGCRVLLLTSLSLRDNADWPRESIDEIFYMPDVNKQWEMDAMIRSVSYVARNERIDRIVPLDDFDLEKAAALREHLRVPGLGETTTRYFRDKLAMRMQAQEAGIPVPDFAPVLNYDMLRDYMARVPAPWLLKPRFEASATGIRKIAQPDELWRALDELATSNPSTCSNATCPATSITWTRLFTPTSYASSSVAATARRRSTWPTAAASSPRARSPAAQTTSARCKRPTTRSCAP